MSANVFKKILAVRQSMPAIPKSAKGHNFSYQSADEVFTAVRSAMNEHNLLLFPSVTAIQPQDGSWVVTYNMTWADADSGETWQQEWGMTVPQTTVGYTKTGERYEYVDDKALGKANTYALRYCLLRTLQITTLEDIELDIDAGNPENLPRRKGASPKRDNPFQPRTDADDVSEPAKTAPADVDWKKFHGWLSGLNVTHEEAQKAVGTDSLKQWLADGGTKEEMKKRIQAYADARTPDAA